MSNTLLRESIRRGLRTYTVASASVAFGCIAAPALAQDAGANDQKGQALDTIVVTGSNIRRVDIETANPVVTIDHAAIQASGKLTLGDLVQDLPAVTGPVTNPRVNNGGGTGASDISLRGLGAQRTLVLVNGHRIVNGDVNSIPSNAIERIEVLTDGASSVYGSDAVGGVVNFILRSNYQGAEFSTDYGISDHDDGQRQGYHFVFGQSTDKGSIMAGIDYNKFDPVLAANRSFSKTTLYYYYGAAHAAGSSRTPTGYVQLPANLATQFGCGVVTLTSLGSPGTSLSNYRCYNPATDAFNFQAAGNLDLVPQERSSAFVVGNYKVTDNVEAYLEAYYNKTHSGFALAPVPLDTLNSPIVIAANNYYNPFGVTFSNSGYRFKTRTIGNGNRTNDLNSTSAQIVTGFKGSIGATSWQWNAYFEYGHTDLLAHTSGFINNANIAGLGPSYKDSSGNIVCGTDPALGGTGPIAGCTPIDIFAITNPATVAALNASGGNSFTNFYSIEKSETAEVNGTVWDLPAGPVQLAAGATHRFEFSATIPDAILVPDPNNDYICALGTGCQSPISGSFNVKEIYAELLIPILKDVPFANALNLTVGDRYSRYSNFGGTNNTKFALEYRPIEDLLLRGTVSKVFRAPTVSDLFAGATSSAPQAIDPCFGLNASQLTANPACKGVVPNNADGTFHSLPGQTSQITGITSGSAAANYELTPEFGKSFDYGFVYDPHWIPGLSLSMDLWRVYLNNEISAITAQNALNLCALQGTPQICNLIHRVASGPQAGQISFVQQPTGNLGRLDAQGTDLQAHYRLPETAFGNFALSFQTTYLKQFSDDPAPGAPGDFVQEYAGHYSTGASAISYANFSRWKALSMVNWNLGPWSAQWTAKYIGKYNVGYANPAYGISACQSNSPPGCELKYGASVYHNISAGYNIEPINTRIDVGIDNLADKFPAIIYQNNTLNANVDVNTFDTIGRFYWARVTVKF